MSFDSENTLINDATGTTERYTSGIIEQVRRSRVHDFVVLFGQKEDPVQLTGSACDLIDLLEENGVDPTNDRWAAAYWNTDSNSWAVRGTDPKLQERLAARPRPKSS